MPGEIYLRFYEELNDYLPPDKRKQEFAYSIDGPMTVENLLHTQGVPDTEVEFVLVNGESVDLPNIFRPGDRVSIYPVFESLDVSRLIRFREAPLRKLRFALSPSLHRLASSLHSLGFDVIVNPEPCAAEKNRILLTTDRAQIESGQSRAYLVRNDNPVEQLKEVMSRFDLGTSALSGGIASGSSIRP